MGHLYIQVNLVPNCKVVDRKDVSIEKLVSNSETNLTDRTGMTLQGIIQAFFRRGSCLSLDKPV